MRSVRDVWRRDGNRPCDHDDARLKFEGTRRIESMVSINEAIHDYLGRGWSIIPIRTGDKRPLLRWEEFQHRHPSEAEARGWLRQWPEAGIGVVTGPISGLVVVDVDAGHGGDESLEKLEHEHGALSTTAECRTGGGGRLSFAKTSSESLDGPFSSLLGEEGKSTSGGCPPCRAP
jgi:bifunctional DNA primase/polymerase-like protein